MTERSTGGSDLCPDCKASIDYHEQGHCPHEIKMGEKICKSELTDTVYRIAKWVDLGGGKIVALHKEPAKPSEVVR